MLVVPADGTLALAQFLSAGRQLFPYVGLFANDVIPDHTFTLGSLVEASFPGYGRILLGASMAPIGNADGSARMQWAPVTWSCVPGSAQKSFGYFVVQLDGAMHTRLLWLERMSPVMDWTIGGQELTLSPQLAVQTLFG